MFDSGLNTTLERFTNIVWILKALITIYCEIWYSLNSYEQELVLDLADYLCRIVFFLLLSNDKLLLPLICMNFALVCQWITCSELVSSKPICIFVMDVYISDEIKYRTYSKLAVISGSSTASFG